MSYIKSRGDATLGDIVRFIKETVRARAAGVQAAWAAGDNLACGVQSCFGMTRPLCGRQQTRHCVHLRALQSTVTAPCLCPAQGISKQALQEDDVLRIINVRSSRVAAPQHHLPCPVLVVQWACHCPHAAASVTAPQHHLPWRMEWQLPIHRLATHPLPLPSLRAGLPCRHWTTTARLRG